MSCPRPRSWPVTAQHLGVVRLSQFSTWLEENCHSLGSHTWETVTVTVTVQHLGVVTLSHTATLIKENTRHLIVHLEKEANWLKIQRKSQISCTFGERAEFGDEANFPKNHAFSLRSTHFLENA